MHTESIIRDHIEKALETPNAPKQELKVADIRVAYKNKGLIELLKARG